MWVRGMQSAMADTSLTFCAVEYLNVGPTGFCQKLVCGGRRCAPLPGPSTHALMLQPISSCFKLLYARLTGSRLGAETTPPLRRNLWLSL